MHGTDAKRRYERGRHARLRGWYERKRREHIDAEIRQILHSHKAARAYDDHITLPPVWGHKAEAHAGDTVYLGHNNAVRSFILSALAETDSGKVSITSPIGLALLGRHPGEVVHLTTLDGEYDYTILKII